MMASSDPGSSPASRMRRNSSRQLSPASTRMRVVSSGHNRAVALRPRRQHSETHHGVSIQPTAVERASAGVTAKERRPNYNSTPHKPGPGRLLPYLDSSRRERTSQSSNLTMPDTAMPRPPPGHRRSKTKCPDSLRPAQVRPFAGVDADLFALVDERRHLHHQPGLSLGRLGHARRRSRTSAPARFPPPSVPPCRAARCPQPAHRNS